MNSTSVTGGDQPHSTASHLLGQIKRWSIAAIAAALLLGCGGGGDDAPQQWVGAWASSSEPADLQFVGISATPLANQTVRQSALITGSGTAVRVRLSNRFGAGSVGIGGASIAKSGGAGSIVDGSSVALRFAGQPSAVIPAGGELTSDLAAVSVDAGQQLSVSVYMPDPTPSPDWHFTAQQTNYVAPGNQISATSLQSASSSTSGLLISEIDVLGSSEQRTIVCLGDSITDGLASTIDAHASYPDQFFGRIKAAGMQRTVVNAGISANRLLHDIVGASTLSRVDKDVLSVPGLSHVILLIGINDIGLNAVLNRAGEDVSADQIIAGLTEIASKVHVRQVKIVGATLTPFGGATTPGYYSDAGELKRQQVNAWVRSSKVFDGFIDFDLALRDPADPSHLRADYNSGDNLHPNDAGYAAMAKAIDLSMF